MNKSIGDLFGELGAQFLKSLPTIGDEARFLEAFRDLLATDSESKRRLKRAKLLHEPIDNPARKARLIAEIRSALPGVTKGREFKDPKATAIAGLRMLTGILIVKGLNGADRRDTLWNATLLLRESEHQIKTLQAKISGGSRPNRGIGPDRAAAWARVAWAEWRAKNPRKPKTEGAKALFSQARKLFPRRWTNAQSFRIWLYDNCIAKQRNL